MSEDNFVWTDELAVEFTTWSLKNSPPFQGRYADVEQFKQSKQKQLEKKDWEIISLTSFDGNKYYNSKGVFSHLSTRDTITSVRRLSDNEVFSIGDEITWLQEKDFDIITGFTISNTNQLIVKRKRGEVILSYIKHHIKQPLFYSTDNVPIYEGDKEVIDFVDCMVWIRGGCDINSVIKSDRFKYFSTAEKAQEFILMNKPCLSLNEVVKNSSHKSIADLEKENNCRYNSLKELVKSKLNNPCQ